MDTTLRALGNAPDAEVLDKVGRLVVGRRDRLYAVDRRTGSVHVFDAGGKRLLVCKPAPEDFPDELTSASLTVTDSGEVFLGDIDATGFVHFAADGTRRGVERPELERGQLEWYAQPGTGWMWVVGHATLYLLDGDLRRFRSIERMPDGAWLRGLGAAAVAPDGSIALLAGRGSGTRVLVYSPTGEPLRSIGLPPSVVDQAPFAFDGHRLVFRSLKLLDLDIRRVQQLLSERNDVRWTPAFASGGKELWLFDGERRIERYRLD